MKQKLITTDFESVLVPEAWVIIAGATGLRELSMTTREIPNFDNLMKQRLRIMRENNLSLHVLQEMLRDVQPLKGGAKFLSALQKENQVIIVSDTFIEFAKPLLEKLGNPTIFCPTFITDDAGMIIDYSMRKIGSKRDVVLALQRVGYYVCAIGDSFNDVDMLTTADRGALIFPSDTVAEALPGLRKLSSYQEALDFVRA